MALEQRGEQLNELQDRTQEMSRNASNFAEAARQLARQEKKKSSWF